MLLHSRIRLFFFITGTVIKRRKVLMMGVVLCLWLLPATHSAESKMSGADSYSREDVQHAISDESNGGDTSVLHEQPDYVLYAFRHPSTTESQEPIGRWNFEEGTGTTARDSTSNHLDGTLHNDAYYSTDRSIGAYALELDGENDFLQIPHHDALSPTTAITIACWAKAAQIVTQHQDGTTSLKDNYVVSKGNSYFLDLTRRWEPKAHLYVHLNGVWALIDSGSASIEPDRWYHLAGTYDATTGTLSFYLDGTRVNSKILADANTLDTSTAALEIGKRYDSRYFPGKIDDVRIYNYALEAEAVLALYKQGNPTDTHAPSQPQHLSAIGVSGHQLDLSWEAATDNVGVAGYRIYRDGLEIGTTEQTHYSDAGLMPSTRYHYRISAYDEAGNESSAELPLVLAASTSQPDVQSAIDAAITGDTVLLPEGESTWTTKVTIPSTKRIIVQGAGSESTTITWNGPHEALYLKNTGSRITQLGFALHEEPGDYTRGIRVSGQGWRIDHCTFKNSSQKTIEGVLTIGSVSTGHPIGVIDQCEFLNSRVVVFGGAIMAHNIWAEPLVLGVNNAVFVEDNTFNATQRLNHIDANYGGRYVFRYNEVTDSGYLEAHSVQGVNRATRSWEIYHNVIMREKVDSLWYLPFSMRGGTGVIFKNVLSGDYPQLIIGLDNVRSFSTSAGGGDCDGTSDWDGNEIVGYNENGNPIINGYPCRDQIGRSTDKWLWTEANPYPPQKLDPAYAWGNTWNSPANEEIDVDFVVRNNSGKHIEENRDYYNDIRPNYSPYKYPHPLRDLERLDTEAPSLPMNITAHVVSGTQIDLSWDPGPERDVDGYKIYRDDRLIAWVNASDTPGYSDTELAPLTTYRYTISAYDYAVNESSLSTPLEARTLALISTEGLIGYWRFEEGSGQWARNVGQSQQSQLDGKISGAVYDVDSKIGQYALSFDGDQDVVTISDILITDTYSPILPAMKAP